MLNQAIVENNAITGADRGPIDEPTSTTAAFFDITEETDALDTHRRIFDYGIFRGNLGMRYVDTSIKSKGNSVVNDEVTPTTSTSSYDYWLPRFNLLLRR